MRIQFLRPLHIFIFICFSFLFINASRPVCAISIDKRTELIEKFCDSKKMRAFLKRHNKLPSITPNQIFAQNLSGQKRSAPLEIQMSDRNISETILIPKQRFQINEENCQEMITRLKPKEFIKILRDSREKRQGLIQKIRLLIGFDEISK